MNFFNLAKSTLVISALILSAVATMGVQACAEPKEYCTKAYSAKADINDCTEFCIENKDYRSRTTELAKELIRACAFGQLSYLSGARTSAAEPSLECDRNFKDNPSLAAACRSGVTAEDLRSVKSRQGPGSSNDRETGNNK